MQIPQRLAPQATVWKCTACSNPLASESDHIAKHTKYMGRDGAGYLFKTARNVQLGQPFKMAMTTGMHTVRNVSCGRCERLVGWTYLDAPAESEQYKVGRYMLEKALMEEAQAGEEGEAEGEKTISRL